MYDKESAFGAWLKRKLRTMGKTKAWLAGQLEYDPSTITKWCHDPSRISRAVLQKIADKVGVEVCDIPLATPLPAQVEGQELPQERIKIYGVNDGVPDHCLIQLTAGHFFRREGLQYVEFIPPWHQARADQYPFMQMQLFRELQKGLGEPRVAVVSGQEAAFMGMTGLQPVLATNTYVGFAMIALESKAVRFHSRTTSVAEMFQHLFLKLLTSGVGGAQDRQSRIACLGPLERKFVYYLLGLYKEIMGQERFVDSDQDALQFAGDDWGKESHGLEILHSLDECGIKARDVVVGDALTLGAALGWKDRYRVLLTLREARDIAVTACQSIGIVDNLKRIYGIDDAARVEQTFREIWETRLAGLEAPVNWYLLAHQSVPAVELEDIRSRLKRALKAMMQYVATDREPAIAEVMDLVKQRRPALEIAPGPFRTAFSSAYKFAAV